MTAQPISPRQTSSLAVVLLTLTSMACAESSIAGPDARRATPLAVELASVASLNNGVGPQSCIPDSRLVGRVALSTQDVPGTWWHLTRSGFDAAGITDYLGEISGAFGIAFPDLDAAVAHLVAQVEPLDANGNGLVCAYRGQGELGWSSDPDFWDYHFGVRDDKHATP